MALINCPECKTKVSDTAFDCPKCAASLKKPTRTIFGKLVKFLFTLFNIFMIIWVIGILLSSSAGLGTQMAFTYVMFIWVLGDIIIGSLLLFTKPSKH
tara:strand:+ start:288 stop:581 length:294 start_codon:yes stop_codon:yes gene_type:complete